FSTYNWTGGSSSQTLSVTSGGSYSVTVTDANGCSGTDVAMVNENSNPVPSISGLLSFCTGGNTVLDAGSFTTYLWTGGTSNQTLSVNSGGDYSVSVTDANGCSGTASVTVTENSSLSPEITGSLEFCSGDSTLLDVGAGYNTYSWSNSSSEQTIYVSASGTYSITVSDVNGCTGTDDIVISENPVPVVTISGDLEFCAGASVVLDAGLYTSYLWTGGFTDQTITVTTGGDYSVTVSDANGCSGTQTLSVTENENPVPDITGSLEICEGNSTTLNAGSGFGGYSWSNGSGQPSTVVNTEGGYSVTVTGSNGCTGSDSVYVTVNANPIPEISGLAGFCEGDSTILSVGSFESYLWSDLSSESQIFVFSTGDYSVTVTDANGCTGVDTASVIESSNPEINITGDLQFCIGDTAMLDAGAGYSNYIWSNGDTSSQIFVVDAGTYTVTVTNEFGCAGSNFIKISTSPSPYPQIGGDFNLCFGESTNLHAGGSYVNYLWSNGSTDSTINVNTSGLYSVTITGESGCLGYASANVVVFEDIVLDAILTNAACPGDANGAINLSISGGNEPYSFSWSNQSEVLNQTALLPGLYSVSVNDLNSCTKSADFLIISDDKDCLNIPTAFSPNEDLSNDTWEIENIHLYEDIHIEIYNRWGQKMFEFSGSGLEYSDRNKQWDGTYNGNQLPISSYVFILDLKNGKDPVNGIVTIKR
ncbi:MAG: gliding motility-associated C-terminal domain-containing protein, partial [Bacteroidales bacterium]|nr:gliding motility-associated C-terminal domain-containing protein [Bacteroidales bacterium]